MKSKIPFVRPLRKGDLKTFKHHGFSVRGMVAELDGEILAVSGVLHSTPLQAFSEIDDKMREYPKVIIKMILSFKDILKHYPLPVYAIANEKEHNSRKVLERVGFKLIEGRTYKWKE